MESGGPTYKYHFSPKDNRIKKGFVLFCLTITAAAAEDYALNSSPLPPPLPPLENRTSSAVHLSFFTFALLVAGFGGRLLGMSNCGVWVA